MDWLAVKTAVADATGLGRDSLRLIAGLAGQLAVVVVLRSWFGALLPWFAVLVAAVANEWIDLDYEIWPDRGRQWAETGKDLVVTMLVPSLLLLLCRFAPSLLVRSAPLLTGKLETDESAKAETASE